MRRTGTPTLDATDERIVSLLGADGRLSVNRLADATNVSRATAYHRLERLREEGVITGFRATIDPAKTGLTVTALILVNVAQHHWQAVRDGLLGLPGLDELLITSGEFDMVLLVRVPDISALRDVVLDRLHGMEHVRSTQTIFVLDEHRADWIGSAFASATASEAEAP